MSHSMKPISDETNCQELEEEERKMERQIQVREHNIEQKGIELIRNWAARNNIPFEDVHEDYSTGVDIVLNGKAYDLKVTRSTWLTFVKKFQDKWYCPLELHAEVPYLILNGTNGYILDKKELLAFCTQQSVISGIELGIYVLDTNLNITFNVERFLLREPDYCFN